ncbi:MAG: hypothetical protein VB115_14350 [Christensenellaceae bacterium]|nr:hypothetical protein [Christensenellaceae bacterium]
MALVIPNIFASSVLEALGHNLKLRGLATDATNLVGEIRNAGDTVTFPNLVRTATATEITKGTPLSVSNVDQVNATATVKHVGAGKRVFDVEAKQIKGAVMSATAQELADAMADKMEADLGAAILADAVFIEQTAAANAITSAEIQKGLDLFGDQVDTDSFAAIVVNSKLRSSFMGMTEFTKADTTYHVMGNGITVNGVIGFYFGIPVMLADKAGTWDSTKNECVSYILKRGALSYVLQQDLTVEEQRPERLFATDLLISSLYATKLLNTKGVAVLRKTTV